MLTDKQKLGKNGELLALQFLEKKGFKKILQNYRFGKGEIDIICEYENDIIIVEVKSVRIDGFGSGEERITPKKQKMIIETTYGFLSENEKYSDFGVRFDVVVVNFKKYPAEVVHYESAFWQNENNYQ
ncbi:MAG: YraN family protein [Calditrichia bacterium]|nr:YraN family protein [Calditrichia bacterium]